MNRIVIEKFIELQERLRLDANKTLYYRYINLPYEEKEKDTLFITTEKALELYNIICFDPYSDRIEECEKLSQLIDDAHKILDNEGWKMKNKS